MTIDSRPTIWFLCWQKLQYCPYSTDPVDGSVLKCGTTFLHPGPCHPLDVNNSCSLHSQSYLAVQFAFLSKTRIKVGLFMETL